MKKITISWKYYNKDDDGLKLTIIRCFIKFSLSDNSVYYNPIFNKIFWIPLNTFPDICCYPLIFLKFDDEFVTDIECSLFSPSTSIFCEMIHF